MPNVRRTSPELRTLINSLPDALIVQIDELIAFANPAFLKLIGAEDANQVVGRHMRDFIHPRYLPAIRDQIIADRTTGSPSSPIELLLVRVDGVSVPVESVGIAISWQGQPAIEVVIRDITARKRSEEVFLDLAKRVELADRAALLGIWELNLEDESLSWSNEIYRQFGLERGSFRGDLAAFFAQVHPNDRAQVEEALTAARGGKAHYDIQFRVLTPEGRVRWIDSHGFVKPEKPIMIGVAHDITELKAAQAQAEENEQNYRLLLNSTAEGIYGLDEHGLCTFCNTAAARMLGYADPEQALGRRMHSTHHHHRPDGTEYPVEDCKIYQAFRQGHGTHAEDEIFFRLNGESFPSEYWSYPIVRNNVIVGSVTTFLDITERRRAEARLRNSEAQYRTIFQSAPYGISRSTADGGILVVNPALVRMLGYETESDLTSITNMARIYAEPEQRSELIAGLHSFGSVNDKEVVWLCKDGRKITVRVNATIVDRRPDGVPEVVQAFVEDVTERKLLEKQFWQAQKMEAVGRLAGGIAHDFNNVLMISRSYAELILQTEGSDDKVRRYAREIEQSSARAASVTRQLLAFSRQQMLAPEYLKLNEVIAELGKILPKIAGEDVEVATLTAEVPCVLADRGQAEQVILNLAVNARDAMPKGGRLSITTRAVTINASSSSSMHPLSPGIYVCLSVADTGIGMDADTKSRIFEPFFTTKDRGKGTGLGLAAVYAIVKQSNGSIFVESEPGDGTTFHIYLPAIPAAATVKPSAPESLCQSGSETVLVVEDEAHLRDAIHEYLTSLGYNVLTAGNATETIQIAMQGASRIDAIITDMVLPGIDGSELADTVSSLHPEARILFMSGYIDRAVEGHGARFPLLRKPFCLSDLASRLRQSLDEDRIGGKETG